MDLRACSLEHQPEKLNQIRASQSGLVMGKAGKSRPANSRMGQSGLSPSRASFCGSDPYNQV